ncbi:apolipoprotein N-acyltransferase [Pararhodobacter marinus]|uniref:apolipoprotein N-acyltransferase n=1 Tax=Pararhodobacter marinus TaxID=2184063 RepID=UPI0035178E51
MAQRLLPYLTALIAGALAASGQAPWGFWPLALAGMALILWITARAPGPAAVFRRALVAGLGQFLPVMVWIVDPFLVDAATTAWMAPFALLLMAGGMALFWAVPLWIAARSSNRPRARIWRGALALVAFEALRGILFTGFPWALSGHVWIGTPVDQIAALGGPLLLSALTLSLAAALAGAAIRAGQGDWRRAALALILAPLALGGTWVWGSQRLAQPLPEGPGQILRLVQANVPQDLKWRYDLVRPFFERHLDLSAAPADPALGAAPDLVLWPETSAPFLLDRPGDGLQMIAAASQVPSVIGIQRRNEAGQYFNTLALIDTEGAVQAIYDKHHLVPFGEYVPLIGDWAARQGWGGLAAQVLSGYTPGPGPELMDLGPAGRALPLICYEAVFPRNLRGTERPDWLLQSTNDAWFGERIGPFQHFAQARLRAIETGLPLARVANTGISAMVDARGRVTAALPMGQMGALDAALPGALPPTPYARTGDLPWYAGLSLAMALMLAAPRLRRRQARAGREKSDR